MEAKEFVLAWQGNWFVTLEKKTAIYKTETPLDEVRCHSLIKRRVGEGRYEKKRLIDYIERCENTIRLTILKLKEY